MYCSQNLFLSNLFHIEPSITMLIILQNIVFVLVVKHDFPLNRFNKLMNEFYMLNEHIFQKGKWMGEMNSTF